MAICCRFAIARLLDQPLAQKSNQVGGNVEWDLIPKANLATLAFSRTCQKSWILLLEAPGLQREATNMYSRMKNYIHSVALPS